MDKEGYIFYNGLDRGHRNEYGEFNHRNMPKRDVKMSGNNTDKKQRSDDSNTVASLDSTGKRKSFKRLITRFAEKTSMQGVPYINNAKLRWAKAIWAILLVIAVGMMIVHLWYLSDQFFGFPKVTKISLGYDNLQFPKITICNTNPMHKGRFDSLTGAYHLKDLIEDLSPEQLVPNQFDPDYDPTDYSDNSSQTNTTKRRKRFIQETDNLDVSNYDPDYVDLDDNRSFEDNEFDGDVDQSTKLLETFQSLYMDIGRKDREYIGHNISDMLLSCTFGGRQCDAGMFYLTQSSVYGNCWSVDKDNFRVSTSGPAGGLSLVMYLETTEYLEGINNGYGLRLLIHQPNTFPFPVEEGHHISASFETNVGMKMIGIERETNPYGKCDPKISEQFVSQYRWSYTRRACQTVCEIDTVVNACGCFDDETEELAKRKNSSLSPCRSKIERECKRAMLLKIQRKDFECYCPVPCQEMAYEKSFSSRQWPTDKYALVLVQSICQSNPATCKLIRNNLVDMRAINYNFLKLNIFYEDLNFENITETPEIEVAQYMSDVGGAVGLWIGLSILSMCEIFQLLIELCQYGYHKTVKERETHRKSESRDGERRHSDSDVRYKHRDNYVRGSDIEGRSQRDFDGRIQYAHSGHYSRHSHEPWGSHTDSRSKYLYGDHYDAVYPSNNISQ